MYPMYPLRTFHVKLLVAILLMRTDFSTIISLVPEPDVPELHGTFQSHPFRYVDPFLTHFVPQKKHENQQTTTLTSLSPTNDNLGI